MPSKEPDVAVKEDQLTQIIRLISGHPKLQIRASDHLADLGLDSLRRLTLVSLIETRLGITIAEENINQETTIATLRKLLNKGSHVEAIDKRPKWTYYKWVRLIGNAVREVVIRGLLRIWVKLRVEGRNNLDNLDTPAIFIFNHTDDFDAPVIYNSLPHYIRKRLAVASASDVLDDHKFLAFIDRLFYAGFNLNRFEPYMPSLMYTSELIDKGWNIVLSPEGRLSPSGRLLPFKLGVGLLAVNLGVPVVPLKTIGLTGTVPLHSKWPKKRSKVTVRIGKPIVFDAKSDYTHATIELQHIMQDL
jgi:long-chain acyl-CoA synthetase